MVTYNNTLILMGGGIDSSYLASILKRTRKVIGIHFDYGHSASVYERKAVVKISKHLNIKIICESFKYPMSTFKYEIKGRNLLLIMAAIPFAIKYECSQIAIGIHKGSLYYDTSEHFLLDMQRILDGYFSGNIQLLAPLIDLTKIEILELSKNEIPLNLTYSCETGKNPCGQCPSCKTRNLINAHN
ncbi:MAG: 7-cyano-7-deazaguanine synthase [Methylococcaceae bacterium]